MAKSFAACEIAKGGIRIACNFLHASTAKQRPDREDRTIIKHFEIAVGSHDWKRRYFQHAQIRVSKNRIVEICLVEAPHLFH